MRITVTGASGHIGGNLVRALVAAGHRVTALYRSDTRALAGLDVTTARVDVRDPEAVARAVEGAEAVFHLAAVVSIVGDRSRSLQATNVAGTENVARACLRAGVGRLVHFSSIHAFQQEPRDMPLDETRALAGPVTALAYDASKAGSERVLTLAAGEGLDVVTVSPTAVLGPYDFKPSPLGGVLLAVARRRLPALVAAGFDWVDVRDVVAGAMAALERGRRGERYLLSGRWASFAELAGEVARAAGVRLPRLTAPLWLAGVGAPFATAWARVTRSPAHLTRDSLEALRTSHHDIRHDKATRELGYRPRPLAVTAADTVAWFRAAGLLAPARDAPVSGREPVDGNLSGWERR